MDLKSHPLKILPAQPSLAIWNLGLWISLSSTISWSLMYTLGGLAFPCFPFYPYSMVLEFQGRCETVTAWEILGSSVINLLYGVQFVGMSMFMIRYALSTMYVAFWSLNVAR